MYWFILLFPLMIYPWGPLTYYTFPKVFYLDVFVLCTWLYIIFKKKYCDYWSTKIILKGRVYCFRVYVFSRYFYSVFG